MSDEPRVALVTGTSRGIGAEIARQLAVDHDFVVFAGARDPDDVEERERIIPIELDVTDQDEIYAAVELIGEDPGRLDALVNNAGVYGDPVGAADYDLDRAHEVLEVNTFGPWRLIEAFLPLLHRSSQPRIVNVSSGAGSISEPGIAPSAYSVSKAALNMLTRQLASELRGDGILVNSVCPGWVATDMGGPGGRPVGEGAASVVWAAVLPDDGPTGGFFRNREPIPW